MDDSLDGDINVLDIIFLGQVLNNLFFQKTIVYSLIVNYLSNQIQVLI